MELINICSAICNIINMAKAEIKYKITLKDEKDNPAVKIRRTAMISLASLDPKTATPSEVNSSNFPLAILGWDKIWCTSCNQNVDLVTANAIDFGDVGEERVVICCKCIKKAIGILNG